MKTHPLWDVFFATSGDHLRSKSFERTGALFRNIDVVGKRGLEPPWIAPPVPKTGAYTNSATCPD